MDVTVRARELELERQGKRNKEEQTQTHQAKRFKTVGQKSEARRDPPKCAKCGKPHSGECRMAFGYVINVESRAILAGAVK